MRNEFHRIGNRTRLSKSQFARELEVSVRSII